jgi:hypothetical protein
MQLEETSTKEELGGSSQAENWKGGYILKSSFLISNKK